MAEDSLKDFQILGDNELMEIKGGDLSTNIRNERLAIGLTPVSYTHLTLPTIA